VKRLSFKVAPQCLQSSHSSHFQCFLSDPIALRSSSHILQGIRSCFTGCRH